MREGQDHVFHRLHPVDQQIILAAGPVIARPRSEVTRDVVKLIPPDVKIFFQPVGCAYRTDSLIALAALLEFFADGTDEPDVDTATLERTRQSVYVDFETVGSHVLSFLAFEERQGPNDRSKRNARNDHHGTHVTEPDNTGRKRKQAGIAHRR